MNAIVSGVVRMLLLTCAAFSFGCAHHYTLNAPQQLGKLPKNRGSNGGSFFAQSPWQYRGSNYGTHEFYYYFNDGNVLHRRWVTIPRKSAVLQFREFAFGSDDLKPLWAVLASDSDPKVFRFRAVPLPSAGGDGYGD